jgi:flagellar motor protein MotB
MIQRKLQNFKKSAWLTTFGDLLTLLLCFVLVCFSLKQHGTEGKSYRNQIVDLQDQENRTVPAHSGRDFASKKVTDSRHRSWIFSLANFESISQLEELQTSKIAEVERVELEVCNFEQEALKDLVLEVVTKVGLEKFNLVLGFEACKNLASFSQEPKRKDDLILRVWL